LRAADEMALLARTDMISDRGPHGTDFAPPYPARIAAHLAAASARVAQGKGNVWLSGDRALQQCPG
jgi:hypothetical protein